MTNILEDPLTSPSKISPEPNFIGKFNLNLLDNKSIDLVEKIFHNRIYKTDNRPRSLQQTITEFEDYKKKNPGVLKAPVAEFEKYIKAI